MEKWILELLDIVSHDLCFISFTETEEGREERKEKIGEERNKFMYHQEEK
jgi:hypothetical protein